MAFLKLVLFVTYRG